MDGHCHNMDYCRYYQMNEAKRDQETKEISCFVLKMTVWVRTVLPNGVRGERESKETDIECELQILDADHQAIVESMANKVT